MDDWPSLAAYGAARDAFFAELVERLRDDVRIAAVWLTGAHGRFEDDEWSDFDMQVAVQDAALEPILTDPRALFETGGEPILVQAGFDSDSIPAGKFWLVVYGGPFTVDWNIGPVGEAARPEASVVVFDRVGVPVTPLTMYLPTDEVQARAQRALEFFWAMALIAAKYAGRGWTERAVLQTELLRRAYVALWRAAEGAMFADDAYEQNRKIEEAIDHSLPRLGASISAADSLGAIGKYCQMASSLSERLESMGVRVHEELPFEAERLCVLAETLARTGGSSAARGSRR